MKQSINESILLKYCKLWKTVTYKWAVCTISGFHHSENEVFDLAGCYVAVMGS